jgi:carboxypeptidase Taq
MGFMQLPCLLDLKLRLAYVARLESVSGILEWDQQVNLPKAAHQWRGEQMGALAALLHQEQTALELGLLLDACDARLSEMGDADVAVVRHARERFERQVKIPRDLAQRKASSIGQSYLDWAQAKEDGVFARFSDALHLQLALAREEASYLDPAQPPYAVCVNQHDPGVTLDQLDRLFGAIEAPLVAWLPEIVERQAPWRLGAPGAEKGFFPKQRQQAFVETVLDALGFDFDRGRMDASLHPFCAGCGQDVRITTRYDESNPLEALYSALHECGHALYEQGLPHAELGNALGMHAGMGVHESQSRLWENQLGRNPVFWNRWWPMFSGVCGDVLVADTPQAWCRRSLRVQPGLIRVDADEVSYNLHVLIRYRLEQGLFSGKLLVDELPDAWHEASVRFFGLSPRHDGEGVLQDVHWASGAFGYFPSYTLGNALAAQLWSVFQVECGDWETRFLQGDCRVLLTWMREQVHRHGRLFSINELATRVSGFDLDPVFLLDYLRDKYLGEDSSGQV